MIENIIAKVPLLAAYPFEDLEFKRLLGKTNKNYLVITSKQKYVLRIPRKATNAYVNRDHESYNSNIAQDLGLSPKTVWRGTDELAGISLTEYIESSNPLKKYDQSRLKRMAEILSALQRCEQSFKGTLDNLTITHQLKQYFLRCSVKDQSALEEDYQRAIVLLASPLCNRAAVPSHVDLVVENILLRQDESIWLIDWEYSAMASPFWDIATICNSAKLDKNVSESLLKMTLTNYHVNDLQSFKKYLFITKIVSDCWQAAFVN